MQRVALIGTLALTLAMYWIGLSGPLVFDDIQNLTPLAEWSQGARGWTSVVFGNDSGLFGRPVAMATFLLNALWLGPGIWGFKLVNVLIHLANGVLVFALFQGFTRRDKRTSQPARSWQPWFACSIWLLHPLLVSTVLYVVQRMAMLSAFFTLLAMLAFLHGRLALSNRQRRRAGGLLIVAMPLATLLAALSKENGVLAPALCGVMELALFQPRIGTRRPWLSTGFIGATLVLPALVAIVLTVGRAQFIVAAYANRPFTLAERLFTQPRVLWDYVGSLVAPFGPGLGLYHDDYVVSRSLFDPPATLIALMSWVAVIIGAFALRRRVPGFLLGVGIFLVGQALESSVFPLLMYFEHRNYLPAVGAIWALISLLAYCANLLKHKMSRPEHVFRSASVALLVVLGFVTAARAGVWQRQSSILSQALRYHPQSHWLRMDLADQAMHQHPPQFAEARRNVDFLLTSREPSVRRLGSVGRLIVDCSAGTTPTPSTVSGAFSGRPDPLEADLLVAFENLSEGVMKRPCPGLSALRTADLLAGMLDRSGLPSANTSIWRLRLKAAKLYFASGRADEALRQGELAYAGGKSDAPVPVFIASILIQRGDYPRAQAMLEKALEQMPAGDQAGHAIVAQYQERIRQGLHH
jgi:hypothetical protein